MGKRILQQRRGRGGRQYRVPNQGKLEPARYPFLKPSDLSSGIVVDILHERGRGTPLAKIKLVDKNFYIPAINGLAVGEHISIGSDSPLKNGSVLPLDDIPEGTTICNIEEKFGDGGKIAKAPGTSALLFSKTETGVVVRLSSGRNKRLSARCRASLGVISGGGRTEKPFLRAGEKRYLMRSRAARYPVVRGVAMTSVYHPFGGGRHQHPGKSTSTSRNAPPGRKVGSIAASKTGPSKKRRTSKGV